MSSLGARAGLACARLGAALVVLTGLCAGSLVSHWHLIGCGLFALGTSVLALLGELGEDAWWPGERTFWSLFTVVGIGQLVLIWAAYYDMAFPLGDTGYYAQKLINLALHGRFTSEALSIHALADHFTPTLFALAPLFRIWPTFVWLPLCKVGAFLATALILVPLSRDILGPQSPLRWFLPTLWLVHAVVAYGVIFDWQATQLAPPLIVLTFLCALRNRPFATAVCLVLLAGLKEDLPLVWVCLGFWLRVEHRRPSTGNVVIVLGILVGLVIIAIVMPAFAGGPLGHTRLIGPTASLHLKLLLVVSCLVSLGGLPLARPRTLIWTLPAFSIQLISSMPSFYSFRYPYQLPVITLLFIASIYGLRDVECGAGPLRHLPTRLRSLVIALGLTAMLASSFMLPFYPARLRWPTPETRETRLELVALRESLPAGVPIYTTEWLFVWLLPREGVYHLYPRKAPDYTGEHILLLQKVASDGDDEDLARQRLDLQLCRDEIARGVTSLVADTPHLLAFQRHVPVPKLPR